MFPLPPPPPFPPTPPSPYYPAVPTAQLGFWALRRLVKQLPPPQTWAEYHYQQARRRELRARRWRLIFSLIPR